MSEDEKRLLESLGYCWNDFCELEQQHPSDADDFLFHLHALQRIVMARETRRNSPSLFVLINKKEI